MAPSEFSRAALFWAKDEAASASGLIALEGVTKASSSTLSSQAEMASGTATGSGDVSTLRKAVPSVCCGSQLACSAVTRTAAEEAPDHFLPAGAGGLVASAAGASQKAAAGGLEERVQPACSQAQPRELLPPAPPCAWREEGEQQGDLRPGT